MYWFARSNLASLIAPEMPPWIAPCKKSPPRNSARAPLVKAWPNACEPTASDTEAAIGATAAPMAEPAPAAKAPFKKSPPCASARVPPITALPKAVAAAPVPKPKAEPRAAAPPPAVAAVKITGARSETVSLSICPRPPTS